MTQLRGDVRLEGGSLRGSSRAAIDAQIKLDRVNAVTLSVCAETSAYCIDLASEIHFLDGDFYDAVRTTPQGSARVGTYLAQKLEPLLLQN